MLRKDYVLIQAQIPKDLRAKLIKLAKAEDRTLASWLRITLEKLV